MELKATAQAVGYVLQPKGCFYQDDRNDRGDEQVRCCVTVEHPVAVDQKLRGVVFAMDELRHPVWTKAHEDERCCCNEPHSNEQPAKPVVHLPLLLTGRFRPFGIQKCCLIIKAFAEHGNS